MKRLQKLQGKAFSKSQHCINQRVLTAVCGFGAWLTQDVEELEKATAMRKVGDQRWEWQP